jgi:hypothetical protein
LRRIRNMSKKCPTCGQKYDPMISGDFVTCQDCLNLEKREANEKRVDFILECLQSDTHQPSIALLRGELNSINEELSE